jgi:hypothetical protein
MKPHTQPNTTTHTFPYLSEKSPLENNFLRILLLKTQRGVMVLVSWEDGSEGTDGVIIQAGWVEQICCIYTLDVSAFSFFLTCFVVRTKSVASRFLFVCTWFRMPNLLESGNVGTQALGVSFCYRGGSRIKNDWKGGREGGRKDDKAPKVS